MSEWWQQNPQDPQYSSNPNGSEEQETPAPEETPAAPDAAAEPQQSAEPSPASQPQPTETVWQTPTVSNDWQEKPSYRNDWTASSGSWQTPPPPPKKPKKNGVLIALVAILGAVCLVCVGITATVLANGGIPTASESSSSSDNSASESENSGTGNPNGPTIDIVDTQYEDGGISTADIVKENLDCTVVINIYEKTSSGYGGFVIGDEGEKLSYRASGIIMSEDGYIITNRHVVIDSETAKSYDRIEVELYNGTLYNATVIGADSDTDLAVIKIDATGLKAATFGDSDKVRLGDRVVTIGNSGGLPWSVSQGVLSGTHRDVYDETGYSIQCLQIDATINYGSSGGPLFNCMGEVIGINSAKIVYSGYENLGFSIPINEAKIVLDDLVRYGYVTGRIELGITGYNVTESGYEGFMIDSINKGSSLENKGIQQYDIITHIDGQRISGRTDLRNTLSTHKAGDEVELTLLRITNNRTGATTSFTVKITLQESKG